MISRDFATSSDNPDSLSLLIDCYRLTRQSIFSHGAERVTPRSGRPRSARWSDTRRIDALKECRSQGHGEVVILVSTSAAAFENDSPWSCMHPANL